MNNRTENLLTNHINRLEKDIEERDQTKLSDGTRCNPFHAQLDEVDLKNIASLREGRIPQYSDHMDTLAEDSMDMFEFADLTEDREGYNPWPSDPALPYDGSPYGEGLSGPYKGYGDQLGTS